jgi:diguanylate cyclase (GGDEF)-like protein/PAS domain S-box-containing protein
MVFALIALSASILAGGFAIFYQVSIAGPLLRLEAAINSLNVTEHHTERIPHEQNIGSFASLVSTINSLLGRSQSYARDLADSKAEMELLNTRLETAIAEETETRQEVELRQVYWRALFENARDAIALVDRDQRIVEVNKAFEELFEYTPQEIKGHNIDSLVAPHRHSEAVDLTRSRFEGDSIYLESTRLSGSGREIEVEIKGIPIVIAGEVVGGYAIYADISKRRQSEREILLLSQRDQLTGLYNRSFFDKALREWDQSGLVPVSLIMGDTNGLKVINDAFGHATGDEMLRRTAQAIRECCRPEDIPARIGGDEFAVLMPGISAQEAETVRLSIEKKFKEQSEGVIHLSMALGMSSKAAPTEKLSQLFVLAEDQMYRRKLREGKSTRSSLIASLIQALQEKTQETTVHSSRMENLSRKLAESLGVSGGNLDDIHLLASLHDIGKIGVPDHILNKPGSLTPGEWEVMKKHSEIGYRIASATVELAHIAEGILYHHEKWDGTGYPQGLKGHEIPLTARIIAIVDAYDAMTNLRAYRAALTHDQALEEIKKGAGTHFAPDIAEAFIALMAAGEGRGWE